MNNSARTFLKITMALLLSVAFVVPANAVFHSSHQEDCPTCLITLEEAQSPDTCCLDEDSERPETLDQNEDCECPDCPVCQLLTTSLHGILSPPSSFAPLSGHAIFSPNIGLDFEILNDAPPLPPPRVG